MKKELFVTAIEKIDKTERAFNKINDVIGENRDVFGDTQILMSGELSYQILRLISDSYGLDTDDDNVLYWWVYDMNFGRDFKIGDFSYIDENGKCHDVDLSTIVKLYDYLEENCKK